MNRSRQFIMSLMLFAAAGETYPMDTIKAVAPEAIAAPITKWPLFLYAEAFPAAIGKPEETQEWVAMQVQGALTATKQLVEMLQLPETELVKLDWAYAVHMVEKTGLLQKPIETLTIDDIKLIASWLTRLTAKNPGSFRTTGVKWPLKRIISPEEQAKLDRIEDQLADNAEQMGKEAAEEARAFLSEFYLYFIDPEEIEPSLQVFLEDMKKLVGWLKEHSLEREERIYKVLEVSSFIHQKAVEIHAFEEGSKRLGRLLMYIFLAQQGLEPITFYDSQLHGDKLIASLTGRDKDAFKMYVRDAFLTSVKMRRSPFYFGILKDLLTQNIPGELFHAAMLNHPLQKAFENSAKTKGVSGSISKPAVQSSTNAKSCAQCGNNSHIKADLKLLVCSGCKAVFYCSTACQKAHWPKHKLACKKAVEKK